MATDNVDLPDLSQDAASGIPHALLNTDGPAEAAPKHSAADLEAVKGTIVELDRKVGEAIDIYVNDRLVARGEVVLVEDRLGITMTEIIKAGSGS